MNRPLSTRDIGVFWDYENVQIPRWCRATDVSNAIRAKLKEKGRIVERNLYCDSAKQQILRADK